MSEVVVDAIVMPHVYQSTKHRTLALGSMCEVLDKQTPVGRDKSSADDSSHTQDYKSSERDSRNSYSAFAIVMHA